jgi:hypothetical protein
MREVETPVWLAVACIVTLALLAAAVIRLWPAG